MTGQVEKGERAATGIPIGIIYRGTIYRNARPDGLNQGIPARVAIEAAPKGRHRSAIRRADITSAMEDADIGWRWIA